jgi:hypothetical protein
LAVGSGCAAGDADDGGADDSNDSADNGPQGGGDLSWLAERAVFAGSLEAEQAIEKPAAIQYLSRRVSGDLTTNGFDKFTLHDMRAGVDGAGFDKFQCVVELGSSWTSPPILCVMGPRGHYCTDGIQETISEPKRYSILVDWWSTQRRVDWRDLTLLVVTSRPSFDAKKKKHSGPSTYSVGCEYVDTF